MTERERWMAMCDDCFWATSWADESVAREHATTHERDEDHTVEVRDLFDTDHRLPDSLRGDRT